MEIQSREDQTIIFLFFFKGATEFTPTVAAHLEALMRIRNQLTISIDAATLLFHKPLYAVFSNI